jgi:hypothetical protein
MGNLYCFKFSTNFLGEDVLIENFSLKNGIKLPKNRVFKRDFSLLLLPSAALRYDLVLPRLL